MSDLASTCSLNIRSARGERCVCVSLDGVATTLVASCGVSWESRLRSVLPGPNGFVMVGFFIACSDKHLCEGAARGRRGGERGWGGGSSNVSRTLC